MLRSLTACTLALGTACSDGLLTPGEAGALAAAEEKWEARAPDAYTFEYASSSAWGFRGWARISVREGLVTGVVYPDSADATPDVGGWPTVDSLFARIHALQRTPSRNLEDVDVEFDETLGYPTLISLGYDRDLQDAGIIYLARNLTAGAE